MVNISIQDSVSARISVIKENLCYGHVVKVELQKIKYLQVPATTYISLHNNYVQIIY